MPTDVFDEPSPTTQLPSNVLYQSSSPRDIETGDGEISREHSSPTNMVQEKTNGTHAPDDLEAADEPQPVKRRRTSFWVRDEGQRKNIPFAQRSLRITWGWFPVTMSTGAMASVIGQQPFTFRGLKTIGSIFYIVDLVLFVTFTALILARFIRKPRAFATSLHHPSESFFFGSFWVSAALLINGMQTYGVPHTGPWLVSALRIIFWIYFALATIVAVFQYQVIFHAEKLLLSEAMPAWILPAYPFLVTGVVASSIAKTQEPKSAVQLLIAGICGQGLGWILALFIYSVYLTRLISSTMPPPSVRPGLYISVGPAAYTCAGILSLGQQAKKHIPPDFLGIESFPVGDVWFAISVPVALFLWLIAIWFSSLSTLSIMRGVRQMSFALPWWAFVFPNAGLAIATIQIGEALNSDEIKIAGTIISVILVPLWFLCAVMHIWSVWRHDLLAPGKDEGVDDVNLAHDLKQKQAEEKRQRRREREKRRAELGRQANGSSQLDSRSSIASPQVCRWGADSNQDSPSNGSKYRNGELRSRSNIAVPQTCRWGTESSDNLDKSEQQ
ncbi:hypothetical protein Golomagni_05912 [Golovinomyces magnicellulatus]|nr:hypothetical protein Golomagni_05912 [Golovinomyces magnicellulatus]